MNANAPGDRDRFCMRRPCPKCESEFGRIEERGAQDCVFCLECSAFQYNAPRHETGKAVRSVSDRDAIKPKKRAEILIVRANGRCEICGCDGTETNPLNVGHLLSVHAGREMGLTDRELNSDENLASMCAQCNLGLGSQPVPLRLAVRIVMARAKIKAGVRR